jgi:WD40 repeat protein
LWDREAKKHLRLPYHQGPLAFAQFSPDGKVLLTANGTGLSGVAWGEGTQLWDTATGQRRGAPLLPPGPVQAVAFSPDSQLLAVTCYSGDVQLWETTKGRPLGRPFRHPGPVYSVAFSQDGSKLVTGGHDGMAHIWDTHPTSGVRPLRSLERVAVVTPDGSRYLQRGEGNTLRLHDMRSGEPCGGPVPWTEKDRRVVLGPDQRALVIAGASNTARLWDAVTGKPIGGPWAHDGPVADVRFSPDGRTVLTLVKSTNPRTELPTAYRWDAATGRSLGFEKGPNVSLALAISPDGRWALRAAGPAAVIVPVSAGRGNIPPRPLVHHGPLVGGLFSPDSRTLLTIAAHSGNWYEARLLNLATGEPLGPPLPHQGPIGAKVFSADGKMVLTGSDDGTARLWDPATGKQLGPVMSHGGRVRAVAIRPDGKLAATAGEDGTARLWHVATGRPLAPPLRHPAAVSFVTFDRGGETLITAAGDRVRVWKVPHAIPGEAKLLLLEAEIKTGMELDGSTPRLLDDEERARRRRQVEGAGKAAPAEGSR